MKNLESNSELPEHKNHKKLIIILAILAVIVLMPVAVLGYYGFVPGLSNALGSKKAMNLGTDYTELDKASFEAKTKIATIPIKNENTDKYFEASDPISVNDVVISDSEITYFMNNSGWAYNPTKEVEVKSKGDYLEISGKVNLKILENTLIHYNANPDFINAVNNVQAFGINEMPFYIKGKYVWTGAVLESKIDVIKVGRFKIPSSWVEGLYQNRFYAVIPTDNFSVARSYVTDGGIYFSGTYPSKIYYEKDTL